MKKCWVLLNYTAGKKYLQKYYLAEFVGWNNQSTKYLGNGAVVKLGGELPRTVAAYRVRMKKPKRLIVEKRTK